MNLPDRPLLVLKVLKGSAISCLTAMLLHGEPVSNAWLTAATGYHPTSVSRALRILSYYEMAHRIPGRLWVLGPKPVYTGADKLADFLTQDPATAHKSSPPRGASAFLNRVTPRPIKLVHFR